MRGTLRERAAGAAVLILMAGGARGQDAVVNALGGPEDLPGRVEGARRPEPEKTAERVPTAAPTEPESPREWFGGAAWWAWSRMTGDWGGLRSELERAGVTVAGSYTLDWSGVWSGGLRNVASTRTALNLNGTFDLAAIAGIEGGSVFVDFLSSSMRGGSRDVGDFHGVSDVETFANVDQISELWYQQTLFDDRLRVKLGKVDANLEFAFPQRGAETLNGADVITPTAYLTMPTWPNPSMGAAAFVYPTAWWYAGAGFFDGSMSAGVPTGRHGPNELWKGSEWFWIGETGLTWDEAEPMGGGRAAIGGWYHSGEFARFDGGIDNGTAGVYAVVEQQLTRREGWDDAEDARGLFAYVQVGHGEEEVNPAANHIALGLSALGTFDGRDCDAAGVYVSWIDLSDDEGSGFEQDETLLEGFYRVEITPWFTVQPTLQYIWNPGGVGGVDDALVGQVRFEISF